MKNTLVETVKILAEQSAQDYQSSSYGQSVCQLHKQDQVSNRLKYFEGRDAVVRKILKLAQQRDDPEVVK